MLFKHIRFHIIVVWEWRGEAFPDDEVRVIATGHLPILYDNATKHVVTSGVIVTGHLPILYDIFLIEPRML